MRYFSSKFEEYINDCKKHNMHKNMESLYNSMSNDLSKQNNLIFYGPSGIGKYTQVLHYIKKYSPTELRFERKINFTSSNKKIEYEFKVSDVHFEIDMALLGCHAKLLFNDIYNQYLYFILLNVRIIVWEIFIIYTVNYLKYFIVIIDITT